MTRVLVVEDEPQLAALLQAHLARAGFQVYVAGDGESALRAFEEHAADLVVLDLMLPRMDGWTVTRRLRALAPVPIVMLTARDQEDDRIRGLELGADDYIAKPCSPREVEARIRAVLRRNRHDGRDVLEVDGLRIDFRTRQVTVDGTAVRLTPTEWRLLETLAGHPGQVFTRLQLIERVYGHLFEGFERTVDAHVKNLRQKIEHDPRHPRYVLTVYGVGYKFGGRTHGA